MSAPGAVVRRARPALGTLVELGALLPAGGAAAAVDVAFARARAVIAEVERSLSVFVPQSDVARFNAAAACVALPVGAHAAAVLGAAARFWRESGGLFDVSLGSGPRAWGLERAGGVTLAVKRSADVRLDLGGIGKGYAVDRAFQALARALGPGRACWVNAGGDLRVRGVDVPVALRDEEGGARPFLSLRRGALATSRFGPEARSRLAGAGLSSARYVSVLAPRCLWSDALTKIVAVGGQRDHPLVSRHGAVAWLHA